MQPTINDYVVGVRYKTPDGVVFWYEDSGEVCQYCGAPLLIGCGEVNGKPVPRCPLACTCPQARAEYDPPQPPKPLTKAELYERAGIDKEYRGIRLGCDKYVKAIKDGRNVFLHGENGTGKTTLAASVAMNLIDEGVKVKFVNAAIVAARIKSDFSVMGREYDMMAEAPVLVLDDLGKGVSTDWEASLWYSVAEARNAAKLPTLTTTNYSGSELIFRLTVNGDDSTAHAIVSRLRGGALVLNLNGKDRRLG